MFHRSRIRIVYSIMIALLLLLGITLTAIVLSQYYSNKLQSRDMLERYAGSYVLDRQPGMPADPAKQQGPRPEHLPDPKIYQVATFYSIAFSDDGIILAFDDGKKEVYTRDDLAEIARCIMEKNGEKKQAFGRTDSLYYLMEVRDGYTLTAFLDNTAEENSLIVLVKNTVIAGGLALAVLLVLAIWHSKRIVQPLEENDKRQKQFVSDAGHELKTPIAAISANAELLSKQLGENEWLENISYENGRMAGLVTLLLDLSRAESMTAAMEKTDLSGLVTGEILRYEPLAYENDRVIINEIEDDLSVKGNRTMLMQLVSILLDNAICHSENGKEIRISLKQRGHSAVLSVSNSGKAFTPEQHSHLFERFYRIDESRDNEGRHYGLGLAIAKAVSEVHGGTIEASCSDGLITFTVTLPLKN